MSSNESNPDLLGALDALKGAEAFIKREAERPPSLQPGQLRRLEEAVKALETEKPLKPPPASPEYERQWREFLERKRSTLEPRAIRYLCWEPNIALQPRFQEYLEQQQGWRPSWLQGLIRSCHARWSEIFAAGPVAETVRRRLDAYDGANRFLTCWKAESSMLLGPNGVQELARRLVDQRPSIPEFCKNLQLDESSSYMQAAIREASARCRAASSTGQDLDYLLGELLSWSHWESKEFKAEVDAVILRAAGMGAPSFLESVKNFALKDSRLGDPRLPANRSNWSGISEGSQRKIIELLSRADIIFFFEHVLPDTEDRHGRKNFWLQYVKNGQDLISRPLLNKEDKFRLQSSLVERKEQIGHYGEIKGNSSAFLLDFGNILVVEFGKMGACFVYQKEKINHFFVDFWMEQPFIDDQLKRRKLCQGRITHAGGEKWKEKLAEVLARNGIRPA